MWRQTVDIHGCNPSSGSATATMPRVVGLLKVRDLMLMQDADLSQLQPRELDATGVGHVARLIAAAPCLRSLNLSGAALSESTMQVLVTALLQRQQASKDRRDTGLTELVLSDTGLADDCECGYSVWAVCCAGSTLTCVHGMVWRGGAVCVWNRPL